MIIQGVDNLFAYCFNSPIINIDPNGMWYYNIVSPKRVKEYIGRTKNPFYTLNLIAYKNMSLNNRLYSSFVMNYANTYMFNQKMDTYKLSKLTPMIYSQNDKYIKDMKYGNYTLAHNGCEIIATYNLLILINKPQRLTNIINEFELNNMYYLSVWSKGYLGTDPDDLYKYFNVHHIKYNKTKNVKTLKKQLAKDKAGKFIVGYWNKGRYTSSIHTVCAKKLKNSNYITVYNYSGGLVTIKVTEFLKRISEYGSFITSYKF